VRLRERFGFDERRFRQLTRLMEFALVGMLFVGLERGHTGIIVNTAVALGVTQLVPVLERDVGIPMDPALTLWITAAVFLHALGTVGIPGTELESFYRQVWWWDHMTHALSASVVAAAGYATARAIDLHSEEVSLPPRFMFGFILLLTVAFGVFWEVIEFAIAEAAAVMGGAPVLTQYGLDDTLLDLVFDTIGAVVVATWGTAYLGDVVGAITDRFEARSG
jgi:VanZ family protein